MVAQDTLARSMVEDQITMEAVRVRRQLVSPTVELKWHRQEVRTIQVVGQEAVMQTQVALTTDQQAAVRVSSLLPIQEGRV